MSKTKDKKQSTVNIGIDPYVVAMRLLRMADDFDKWMEKLTRAGVEISGDPVQSNYQILDVVMDMFKVPNGDGQRDGYYDTWAQEEPRDLKWFLDVMMTGEPWTVEFTIYTPGIGSKPWNPRSRICPATRGA